MSEPITINIGDTIILDADRTDLHPELVAGREGRVVGLRNEEHEYLIDFWSTRKRIHYCLFREVIPRQPQPIDTAFIEKAIETEGDLTAFSNSFPNNEDLYENPKHYTFSELEPLEVIKQWGGKDAYEAFCWGNIIKYCGRFNHKNGVEDLKKARVYLDKLIGSKENE